jgi:putative ABC transport system ATP-binding protein
MLNIESLCKSHLQPGARPIEVLKDISFDLSPGATCSITGQSGSGKTTLLSLIAGLDTPDSGRVILDGQNLSAMGENQLARFRGARIGIVFQSFHLMPHLTARENISLPLEILRQDRIAQKTDDMLEKVGLKDRQNHLPGLLSGGECQRVAIARALVIKPSLLLADEPTGNLDLETGKIVIRLLFDLVEKENKTLILVTHNPDLASKCKHVKKLERGGLV